MTNSKNTKRALFASVLSMMLCVSMLVGSTFAWFTDSVTSGKNKIVAGNLDVELYSVKGDVETPVKEDTNLFLEDALWEPGHVEVVNLKVANLGTLALKYQFGINVADEQPGTNVAGETFRLSDYIKFALIDGNQNYSEGNEGRTAAIAAAEKATAVAISELAVNEAGVLYPTAKATEENPDSRYVTLVVYMPTTVGNEANYRGENIPEITLGVNLVATQTPYEPDSFGNTYDENAASKQNMNAVKLAAAGYKAVGSLGDLEYTPDGDSVAVITSGGKLFLNNDVDGNDPDWYFSSGKSTTLDLNGYNHHGVVLADSDTDLTIMDSVGDGSLYYVEAGQGTVTLENCIVKKQYGNAGMIVYTGATMIVNGGEYNPVLLSTQGKEATIIINDGNFLCNLNSIQNWGGAIIVNGGTFQGDIGSKAGITLGEGKQCVENGDGTWSVVPAVDEGNIDDPFA